jgi:hypothetical protein
LARNKIGHVCLINLSKVQADDDSWFWILGQTFVVVKDAVRRTIYLPTGDKRSHPLVRVRPETSRWIAEFSEPEAD